MIIVVNMFSSSFFPWFPPRPCEGEREKNTEKKAAKTDKGKGLKRKSQESEENEKNKKEKKKEKKKRQEERQGQQTEPLVGSAV